MAELFFVLISNDKNFMDRISLQLSLTYLYCMNVVIKINKYIKIFLLSLENKAYISNSLLAHPRILNC